METGPGNQELNNNLPAIRMDVVNELMTLPSEHASRVEKARKYYADIIESIVAKDNSAITTEDDEALNGYAAACAAAAKEMQAKRSPFFRDVDMYRSLFTTKEKEMLMYGDRAKMKRDQVATYRQNLIREQERIEAERIRLKSLMIDYRQQVVVLISSVVQNAVSATKGMIVKAFTEATLGNIDKIEQRLIELSNETALSVQWPGIPDISAFNAIGLDIREGIYRDEIEKYSLNEAFADRQKFIKEYIDKIPNKRIELKREEEAGIEELKKIEAERLAFQEAERARINKEVEESLAAKQAEAAMAAEAEKGKDLFDAVAEVKPQVPNFSGKEDCEIRVTTLEGYTKIISLWLRHEAPGLSLEDLPKKAISSMVVFAKKRYLTYGEKIEDSGIEYIDKVSTRTRSVK